MFGIRMEILLQENLTFSKMLYESYVVFMKLQGITQVKLHIWKYTPTNFSSI